MTTRNNLVLLSLIRNVLFCNYLKWDMAGWEGKASDRAQTLTHARENTVCPVVVKHPQHRVTAALAKALDSIQTLTSSVECYSYRRLKAAIKMIIII